MATELKWHRECAEAVADHCGVGSFDDEHRAKLAGVIADHDPSAELLRECAKVISSMMASEEVAEANGYGALSPEDIDAARSALARLAEAGVTP